MKTIDDLKNIIREKDKLINHTNIYAHRTLAQSLNRARRKSRLGKQQYMYYLLFWENQMVTVCFYFQGQYQFPLR